MSHINLQQVLALAAAAMSVLGGISISCTALGHLLLLLPKGGKAEHAGNALVGAGMDVKKVAAGVSGFLQKLGAPPASALILIPALLLAGKASAQDVAPCLGVKNLHCGISASMMEVRPGLPSAYPVAIGAGPSLEYHFQKWSVGGAVFGNSLLQLVQQAKPQGEITAAVFACMQEGSLKGFCVGPGVVVAGPNGGLVKGFNPQQDVGLVLSAAPDLLSLLNL